MTTATPSAPVKTKAVADRRQLRFGHLSDLLDDLDQFDGAEIKSCGNWSPPQVVQHVNKVVRISLDGVDLKAPWPLRVLGRFIKGGALNEPMKPGVKLPGKFKPILPDDDVTWGQAVSELRGSIDEIEGGRRMDKPSPIFGELSHEQWEQLHCRHAEMHFSFLKKVE